MKMENSWFQDLLNTKAVELGRRLSAIVSALRKTCSDDAQSESNTTVQDLDIDLALFEEIIIAALTLKSRLPFKEALVEFYLPAPGNVFIDRLMDSHVSLSAKSSSEEGKVLLAVSPAILLYSLSADVYAHDKAHIPSSILDCMVSGDMNREQGVVVCEALVVCEKA